MLFIRKNFWFLTSHFDISSIMNKTLCDIFLNTIIGTIIFSFTYLLREEKTFFKHRDRHRKHHIMYRNGSLATKHACTLAHKLSFSRTLTLTDTHTWTAHELTYVSASKHPSEHTVLVLSKEHRVISYGIWPPLLLKVWWDMHKWTNIKSTKTMRWDTGGLV